ncbi:heavy metal translocating P-type ATPase [soil metagenome]
MTDPLDTVPVVTHELEIGGMTCASCAARIERKLNKLEGVTATVNYALETARVVAPESFGADQVIDVVEGVGYQARVHDDRPTDAAVAADETSIRRSDDELGRRVLLVGLLSVPLVAMGMVPALQFTNWQWLSLMLAFPVATWGAWPFHRAAWANLRHGSSTMDTLVSVGVLAAFAWSFWALFGGGAGVAGMRHDFTLTADRAHADSALYFEVVGATTLFLLAGRWFEARAKRRGGDALRALADLGAKEAVRLDVDGREERVGTDALEVGDRFVVRPGEQVATDGVVVEGTSAIDASLVTGESVPAEVGPGDAVTGATVNAGGRLVVRATRVGSDTTLARMAQLVNEAQSGKAPVQRLADQVAAVFVPAVITLAAATFGYWLGAGAGFAGALTPAVALLIVACPCALGLATPTALLVGTGRGAQVGVLIRGPQVLEATRRIDTIVLDKTGTVTTGQMVLAELVVAHGVDRRRATLLAASLEAASEHPIARAVRDAVPEGERVPVAGFRSTAGLGVEGVVDGVAVVGGRPSFLRNRGFELPALLATAHEAAEEQGRTSVAFGWEGSVRALAVVSDRVRPSSASAIAELRDLGLTPILLTGDNPSVAQAVAAEVGIDRVVSGVLPHEKVAEVQRLQAEGRTVAVVGDGVNDAAALAQADLGLAMGTGTDVAREAADITLVRADLWAAVDAVRLSRRTLRTIKANLVWAFAYNVAAIPVAAAGLLNPMLAGVAMAFSSVFVVANSLRLFRFAGAEP